jgi:hypothetical protein
MTLYRATAEGQIPMTMEEELEFEASRTPQPPSVPNQVDRLQARLVLLNVGKWTLIQPAITSLDEPQRSIAQAYFEDARYWHRNDPFVLLLAPALSLDSAALDALFITAAAL